MEKQDDDLLAQVGVFLFSAWLFPTVVFLFSVFLYVLGFVGMDVLQKVFSLGVFYQKIASFPLGSIIGLSLFIAVEIFIIRLAWRKAFRIVMIGLILGALGAASLLAKLFS